MSNCLTDQVLKNAILAPSYYAQVASTIDLLAALERVPNWHVWPLTTNSRQGRFGTKKVTSGVCSKLRTSGLTKCQNRFDLRSLPERSSTAICKSSSIPKILSVGEFQPQNADAVFVFPASRYDAHNLSFIVAILSRRKDSMAKRWIFRAHDSGSFLEFANELKIDPVVSQLLLSRGISQVDAAKLFLECKF